MGNDFKWIGWDKPETIISRMALEMEIPKEYLKLSKPGTFKFNDGTTQGWAIDQLYDTNDPTMTKIPPYTDPNTGKFYGFSLSNHLVAGTKPRIGNGTHHLPTTGLSPGTGLALWENIFLSSFSPSQPRDSQGSRGFVYGVGSWG